MQEQIREILDKYYIYQTREQAEQGYSVNSRLEQEITTFIEQLLSQQRQQDIEKIELIKYKDDYLSEEQRIHNLALDAVIKELNAK